MARRALDDEFARRGSYSNGVHDIILIARVRVRRWKQNGLLIQPDIQTDKTFGTVWGDKIYYGRVRDWDGLIVLVSADVRLCWLLGFEVTIAKLLLHFRRKGNPRSYSVGTCTVTKILWVDGAKRKHQ